ncbi:uncharacterized protein LOC124898548 [Capsicum annuum]|uniref:uncharacterized protein LOC124898548 n=1 Tax=Capsicum annuum TaxID=4072 RepID=UPI001FB09EF0|nr:uncharacterized protein LOC124898548 [Capsicum annuum]
MADQQEADKLAIIARAQVNVQNDIQKVQHPKLEDKDLRDDELLNPGNPRHVEQIAAPIQCNANKNSPFLGRENIGSCMAITTRSGKILLGRSVGKSRVENVIEVDGELEKYNLVESKRMDGIDIPSNHQKVDELEKGKEKEKKLVDLVTKKRAVSYELEHNLHHCSAISTSSLVQKKADPGASSIPCTIGSLNFAKALCDLGANKFKPLATYKKLDLGDPTLTNIRLVMADRSIKRLVGILHDVSIKVADFILPVDFLVLYYEVEFEVPIIFGIPFTTIGKVVVDMELHELKYKFNDKETTFKMHSSKTQ